MLEIFRNTLHPVHPAGWPFVIGAAILTVLGYWLSAPLGHVLAVTTAWIAFFFRDPPRVTPLRAGLVISPADGCVQQISEAAPPPELGMGPTPLPRISIFLSAMDVHVNRVPVDATASAVQYRPGKFLNAALDKASDDNERVAMRLAMADGRELAVVQIAGLVARRIICDVKPGDHLRAGARFGLIRFGSRVDVYLPAGTAPLVALGQRVISGESVIADFASSEAARRGEMR
jgi:phosphatidylserine decarboxylase